MSTIQTGTYEKYGARYATLTLTDGAYALTVTPEKGGMATSFTKDGQEYLWLRDKNFESTDRPRCGIPILFPNCGKPDGGVHHFAGGDYPIEIHGLADLVPWQVKTASDDAIELVLRPNGLTKFVYPFEFPTAIPPAARAGPPRSADPAAARAGRSPPPPPPRRSGGSGRCGPPPGRATPRRPPQAPPRR